MRCGTLRAGLASVLLVLAGCDSGGGSPSAGGGAAAAVASVDPPRNATGVPRDSAITVRFRQPMDAASLGSGNLVVGVVGVPGALPASVSVAPSGLSATLTPLNPLAEGREHQVRLSAAARFATGRSVDGPWHSEFHTASGPVVGPPPPPPPPPPPAGTVAATGSLGIGRSSHAMVLLPDGRVAAFGGFSTSAAVTASIEIYDPAADAWEPGAATLTVARARCTAVLLGDGTVLVAGGETASITDIGTDRWEVWDPAEDAVVASGNLVERRTNHRAILLPSGRVLLVGGSRTDTAGGPNWSRTSAEVFDPATRTSAAVGSMSVPRAGHAATLLPDGTVLCTGGHGSLRLAELFDEETGTFSPAGEMRRARRDHAAVVLADGSVLLAGGGTNEAERLVGGNFVGTANMTDARSLHSMVRVAGGKVFVVGGERSLQSGGTLYHTITEVYDPATGQFNLTTLSTATGRSGHATVRLANGEILVSGGKHPLAGAPSHAGGERFRFP